MFLLYRAGCSRFDASDAYMYDQNDASVGWPEADDRFGASVAAADIGANELPNIFMDSPGEDYRDWRGGSQGEDHGIVSWTVNWRMFPGNRFLVDPTLSLETLRIPIAELPPGDVTVRSCPALGPVRSSYRGTSRSAILAQCGPPLAVVAVNRTFEDDEWLTTEVATVDLGMPVPAEGQLVFLHTDDHRLSLLAEVRIASPSMDALTMGSWPGDRLVTLSGGEFAPNQPIEIRICRDYDWQQPFNFSQDCEPQNLAVAVPAANGFFSVKVTVTTSLESITALGVRDMFGREIAAEVYAGIGHVWAEPDVSTGPNRWSGLVGAFSYDPGKLTTLIICAGPPPDGVDPLDVRVPADCSPLLTRQVHPDPEYGNFNTPVDIALTEDGATGYVVVGSLANPEYVGTVVLR